MKENLKKEKKKSINTSKKPCTIESLQKKLDLLNWAK